MEILFNGDKSRGEVENSYNEKEKEKNGNTMVDRIGTLLLCPIQVVELSINPCRRFITLLSLCEGKKVPSSHFKFQIAIKK